MARLIRRHRDAGKIAQIPLLVSFHKQPAAQSIPFCIYKNCINLPEGSAKPAFEPAQTFAATRHNKTRLS